MMTIMMFMTLLLMSFSSVNEARPAINSVGKSLVWTLKGFLQEYDGQTQDLRQCAEAYEHQKQQLRQCAEAYRKCAEAYQQRNQELNNLKLSHKEHKQELEYLREELDKKNQQLKELELKLKSTVKPEEESTTAKPDEDNEEAENQIGVIKNDSSTLIAGEVQRRETSEGNIIAESVSNAGASISSHHTKEEDTKSGQIEII